jgi:hypothetical protein
MENLPRTRSRRARARALPAAFGCLLLLALLAGVPAAGATTGAPASQPAKGKAGGRHAKPLPAYWGAWIGPQITGTAPPWDMSGVSQFEGLVGKGLSLVEFSAAFANCRSGRCEYFDFPTAQMNAIRAYGAIPVLSFSSSGSPEEAEPPVDPPFQFAKVIAGEHDPYIRRFAEEARDWGHPLFLRYDWEMNGNWFAWSEGVNGNQPGEFVTAWRHVHDIFTSVGANNVSWVWCPFADPSGKFGNLGSLYPGDAYVDWTCMDGYNWAANTTNPHPWRSFDRIFSATYRKLSRRVAPTKPIMIGEIASTGKARAKAIWIR